MKVGDRSFLLSDLFSPCFNLRPSAKSAEKQNHPQMTQISQIKTTELFLHCWNQSPGRRLGQ